MQHLYSQPEVRDAVLKIVASDVSEFTRDDVGREGFNYWQILVLGVVRFGCNLNYDKLQDLCENHRALRGILGVGEWDPTSFGWRRLRDTLCLLKPKTFEQFNHLIVFYGQEVHGDARQRVRADSFVCETNIHYPTERSLIWGGMKKLISLGRKLAESLGIDGWRQASHQRKKIEQQVREIARLSASKSGSVKTGIYPTYGELLQRVGVVLDRVRSLQKSAKEAILNSSQTRWLDKINPFYAPTSQVVSTAYRHAHWLDSAFMGTHQARKHHSGIESAIGALQSGNGVKRCRDRTEVGFQRYLGWAVLGQNINVLGKLVIAKANAESEAARTKRKKAG